LAFSEVYRKQVELLIRILPFIAEEDCFALKGGTAINLFIRNMPRLSVDIDLTCPFSLALNLWRQLTRP
jgi:predicted nucleotidyltransferase component of viral defense system